MQATSKQLALAGTLAALVAATPVLAAPASKAKPSSAKGSAGAQTLTIETHTAPETAFLVSSHVVTSGGEALLVDAQMLLDQVEQFIELARGQKGKVKAVFITHAHPENYLGLARLREAFPEAQLLAPPDVAQAIREEGERTLKYYRETYSNGVLAPKLPTSVPEVKPHTGKSLRVGSAELEVLSFPQTEGKSLHALLHRPSGTLLAGDLVYNNAHLLLVDQPPRPWIAALEKAKALEPTRIYPGHGAPGGPELLESNLEYLHYFRHVIETTYSAGGVVQRMRQQFPTLQLLPNLHMTAARFYPPVRSPEETGSPGGEGTRAR